MLANDALEFFFVRDAFGFGIESLSFDLQCLACDAAGVPSKFIVEVLDNMAATIVRLDQFVELNSTPELFGVRFLGVNSNRIRITRDTGPLSFSNWMLDDARFSYATGRLWTASNHQPDNGLRLSYFLALSDRFPAVHGSTKMFFSFTGASPIRRAARCIDICSSVLARVMVQPLGF